MGKVNLAGNVPVIGQSMTPYAISGFALGLPFDLAQAQKTFLGATNAGAQPDVFFAMMWTHTAVHLEYHTQEIGKLAERCAMLEGAVDQLVRYVSEDDVKILPPPLALSDDHRLACGLTRKEGGGVDVGSKTN